MTLPLPHELREENTQLAVQVGCWKAKCEDVEVKLLEVRKDEESSILAVLGLISSGLPQVFSGSLSVEHLNVVGFHFP